MAQEVNLIMYLVLVVICNLYFSNANQNIWHSNQFDSLFPREELIITDVITDNNFKLTKEVAAWKSVSANGKIYAVGLSKNSVVILNAEPDHETFVITEKTTEFRWNVTNFEIFEHWNLYARKLEIVLILSIYNRDVSELHWYRINATELEHFWTWPIHKNVTHLRFLQLDDDKYRLLILTDAPLHSFDLYEFILSDPKNFWLAQTLPISCPANSSALNFYGPNFYLSIPQKQQNEVTVYKMEDNHFKIYHRIQCNNVAHVSEFKIGSKSFLTVGGEEAGIYKFTKHGIESENIEGLPLSDVDFWLPLPIKTYRDEAVLILQRDVLLKNHRSFAFDAVTYDGQNFVKIDEVPCNYFGELMHGLECLVDEEGHLGLFGTTGLFSKNILGLLVPHKENTVLYMVHSSLRSIKSPIELEIEKLKETRDQLQKMIDEQESRIRTGSRRNKVVPETPVENIDNTSSAKALHLSVEKTVPVQDELRVDFKDLAERIDKIGVLLDETRVTLSTVALPKLSNNNLDSLRLSGQLRVLGKTNVKNLNVRVLNEETVEDILKDIVRKRHLGKITGSKTFTNLKVENITFDTVNGVDATEIIFNTTDPIVINGNISFEDIVSVNGHVTAVNTINKLDLLNEIVEMSKTYEEPLEFEHVKITKTLNTLTGNNVSIPKKLDEDVVGAENPYLDFFSSDDLELFGDITVENLNGENFDTFKKSIYFTNLETYLPGDTFVDGKINVLDSADVQYLNDVKFPEEYVLKNWTYVTIKAEKHFGSPVYTNQLLLENDINGVVPSTILTRTTNQSMPGKYMFDDFEATEVLNVGGEILGSYIDKLVPNPSMTESNVIDAKVIMTALEVEGTITIKKNYNNQNLQEILQDVVYKDEPVVNIAALKNFTHGFSVTNGINIISGAVNNVQIQSLVTTSTDQELLFKTLNGPVTFENLELQGLYGGMNVTKLEEETVKLSGDQFIEAELIFINNNDDTDLLATEMEILDTVNHLSATDYFYKFENNFEMPDVELSKIKAKNVVVEGNVQGTIGSFSVEDFDVRRLSFTKSQEVSAQYSVKNLYSKNFDAKMMNGATFEKLFDDKYCTSRIAQDLLDAHIKIHKIMVNGSISMQSMNGVNVTNMMKNYLWSNQNNFFNIGVFEADVFMNHLSIKNFNEVDFPLLFDNVVYKNELDYVINGFKTFTNGLRVTKMLNSERLNGIHVDNILTKSGEQQIEGPLHIIGNVVINNDGQIRGNLNGVSVPYLFKTYKLVDNILIINDDLVFRRLPYINNLIVNGYVNERHLNNLLQNLIYKNHGSKISGNTTFIRNVQIKSNLMVTEKINGVDFSDFVQGMVFITADDLINGKVTFVEAVRIEDELGVDFDLETKYLNGIDLDRWKNTAIFVNQGMIRGKLTFDVVTLEGNVYINYVNDIEINSLIPLRTEQYINQTLEFLNLSLGNVSVKGQVNGYNFLHEYQNTVLKSTSIIEITSNLEFENNVVIHDNLQILGLINNNNISNIVTTNTEQNLTANFKFDSEVTIESNVEVNGLINEINITEWFQRSIRTVSNEPQIISDNWTTTGSVIFKDNVVGDGLIKGLNVRRLADAMEEKRLMRISSEDSVTKDYMNMCKDVSAVMSIAKKQIYLFKYLEYIETFTFNKTIESVHHFRAGVEHFIIVTEINACASHLLNWSKDNFTEIAIVEMGSVSQIVTVYIGDLVFLVSRSDVYVRGCKYSGTNVWKFVKGDIIPLQKLEDYKQLQKSLAPGTFYAMSKTDVVEYHITSRDALVKVYRKWKISTDNLIFVPRGVGIGLALSSGLKLFKLIRKNAVSEDNYGYEIESFERGRIVMEENGFLPGYKDGDIVVLNVGFEDNKRSLVAVASHEKTSVIGKFDFIKIYENVLSGKVFHKVPTYKPSSLLSLELGNGETLLIFLEDEEILQVYEYKGIEGFKYRTSEKLAGSKLIAMTLPTEKKNVNKYVIGVVNKNTLTTIYAFMSGNQMDMDEPKCRL